MAATPREIQIRELKDTISQLNTTIKVLTETIAEGQKREAAMQEQIDYLTKKLFGRSSEKHITQVDGQMSLFDLFDEAEKEADPSAPEPSPVEDDEVEVKAHTRKKKPTNDEKFANLKVKEVLIELPDSKLICPQCGSMLETFGKEYVREEIVFIPARMERIKYYTVSYRCKACCEGLSGFDKGVIMKGGMPDALIPRSSASPSSVAWTMYQKYANAMPLYRQEKDWLTQYGVILTRATLAKWIIYCSDHYLKPLYEYFHREMLKRKFLMADETRIQVLKEPGRDPQTDSFMWLFRTGEDGEPPIIVYGYTQTRAKYNAEAFLKGFEGYLETDGYQGYNNLPGIRRCCCWSHVRRGFVDAIPKGHKKDMTDPAVQGVAYCDKLFYYERKSVEKEHTFEQRHEYRLSKEKPVIDAFMQWLDKQDPLKGSRMEKAVNYARNRREYLMTYLEDGRCSLSNNLSENAIRPFTVGRKNWLFADTPNGTGSSAICYTMIEMAKAHNLNPFLYLNYVLTNRLGKCPTDAQLSMLAPWSDNVQAACKELPSAQGESAID